MDALRLLSAAALCAISTSVCAYQLVLPLDPVVGEKVLFAVGICQGASPTIASDVKLEVEPSALHLKADIDFGGFAVSSCERIRILSAPLMASGSYDALFSYRDKAYSPPRQVAPTQTMARVTVKARPADTSPSYRRLSGNWFDPAAPGTGVNMVQGVSGALFAVWATHPPRDWFDRNLANGMLTSDAPMLGGWFVMPEGLWISPTEFRGPLFKTRGSSVESAWDPAALEVAPVGFAKLTFVSDEELRFEVTITYGADGVVTQTQTLRRFRF